MKRVLLTIKLAVLVTSISWCQLKMVPPVSEGSPPATGDSGPHTQRLFFKGKVYFVAFSDQYGAEIWMSDGTTEGTQLLKDITPGYASTQLSLFVADANRIYIITSKGQIWISDGTAANTIKSYSLFGGKPGIVYGSKAIYFNSTWYFAANTPEYGTELWSLKWATPIEANMVMDFNPGPASSTSLPGYFAAATYESLYFIADDGVHGKEIWKIDGTRPQPAFGGGTYPELIKDFKPGPEGIGDTELFAYQDKVVFTAEMTNADREIWSINNSIGGNLQQVTDGAGTVQYITDAQNGFFYVRSDGKYYRSNTSLGSEQLILDQSVALPADGAERRHIVFQDKTYFINNKAIWKTDGSQAGTLQVISPSVDEVMGLTVAAGKLWFQTYTNGETSRRVFASDGTTNNLTGFAQLNTNYPLLSCGSFVFASANNYPTGIEPWISDGTGPGTTLLRDIMGRRKYGPELLAPHGNGVLFTQYVEASHHELFHTDGTITTSITTGNNNWSGSEIQKFRKFKNEYLFSADANGLGRELWKTNGTAAGTQVVSDIIPGPESSHPAINSEILVVGDYAYFLVLTTPTSYSMWRTNGTGAGTTLVHDFPNNFIPSNLTVVGSSIFFTGDGKLWKSDGTSVGTVMVKNLHAVPTGNFGVGSLKAASSILFFANNDGVNGWEIWKSDGTDAGTIMIKDIFPGNDFLHAVNPLAVVNINGTDVLYFVASENETNYELWRTDGTEVNTYRVKDVRAGSLGSSARFIAVQGQSFYFSANDGVHGEELWVTNGTDAGTNLVGDLFEGPTSSDLQGGSIVAGKLFVVGTAAENSRGMWFVEGANSARPVPLGTDQFLELAPPTSTTGSVAFFNAVELALGPGLWINNFGYQEITFDPIADRSVAESPFQLNASSSSGLPVQFTVVSGPATLQGTNLSLTGGGLVTITASQPGNSLFNSAQPITRTFTALKVAQTISVSPIPQVTAGVPFTLTATATSGLKVVFEVTNGNATIDPLTNQIMPSSGFITISANQSGNQFFAPAPTVLRTVEALKQKQTITFPVIEAKKVNDPPFALNATSSSGLAVSYEILEGPAAINGKIVTLTGVGQISIKAQQAGDLIFEPALNEYRTFEVRMPDQLPVGLEDSSIEVQVYPNPAQHILHIDLPRDQHYQRLTLHDSMGRPALVVDTGEAISKELSVTAIPRGIYILRAEGNNVPTRFIKVILQ